MGYEEFKVELREGLQDYYGDGVEVDIRRRRKNNGQDYDGVGIMRKGRGISLVPLVRVEWLYTEYREGRMDLEGCMEAVRREMEGHECPEGVEEFVGKTRDWEQARRSVYPILLSTEANRELLKELVSVPMLDLSVAYIIRGEIGGFGGTSIKVTKDLLGYYGASEGGLHRQAMENLGKEGYRFQDMEEILGGVLPAGAPPWRGPGDGKMYVLTNAARLYGAAGILDRKMVREFAQGQDYYILPSSIHETIFVPASSISDSDALDWMVAEVNETQVDAEERLSNHSYYYDGRADEIRIRI